MASTPRIWTKKMALHKAACLERAAKKLDLIVKTTITEGGVEVNVRAYYREDVPKLAQVWKLAKTRGFNLYRLSPEATQFPAWLWFQE